MEIVLASRNKKKIGEMNTLLQSLCKDKVRVLSLDEVGYTEEIEENGRSFFENSIIKASAPATLGYIGVADDSGLCVDALGGAPGIYSARYSGEDATDEKNNEKLLSELENEENREGAFCCSIATVIPKALGIKTDKSMTSPEGERFVRENFGIEADVLVFCGECRGTILEEPAGEGGFGYDPLFYIPEKGKTFSQLSAGEKNEISHRGLAMKSFSENFNKIVEENNI